MRVGIIGCGSIGSLLAQMVSAGRAGDTQLLALMDVPAMQPKLLAVAASCGCGWTTDLQQLLGLRPDLVVEAAGMAAARSFAVPLLRGGTDVLMMSAGALAEADFRGEVRATAAATRRRVYVPSGALGGLDAVKAAMVGDVASVTLTTTKPPAGLVGAPFFSTHPIDLAGLTGATRVFEGFATEAIGYFPANVNVAVALSLAGLGPEQTRVRILADPALSENIHQVDVQGEFGTLQVRTANRPSPANPRTSLLAAWSAVALLRRLSDPIQVGT